MLLILVLTLVLVLLLLLILYTLVLLKLLQQVNHLLVFLALIFDSESDRGQLVRAFLPRTYGQMIPRNHLPRAPSVGGRSPTRVDGVRKAVHLLVTINGRHERK